MSWSRTSRGGDLQISSASMEDPAEYLTADYIVVGAGAMGMAFVDVIMTETLATILLVDNHDQAGGHWNDAYPFVRLHQASAFYGVNSLATIWI